VGQLYAMMLSLNRWVFPDRPRTSVGVHCLNHACAPNTGLYPYRGHVLVSTLRRVFPGEELTYDYWMSQPDPDELWHPCLCGVEVCRGSFSMGSAWQTEQVRRLFISRSWANAPRKVRVGEMLPPLPSYPKKTRDLAVYNLFGHPRLPPVTRSSERRLPEVPKLRELLRESGRRLWFPRPGVLVQGILAQRVVAVGARD
jgi:hypothetical protein